jgi:PTH1 family peptidyl-tRNA hydrolase
VGFRIVEAFAARHGGGLETERHGGRHGEVSLGGCRVALLEPLTFMNASGESVARACAALPDFDPKVGLVVVYDDLDLPLGRIRIRQSGGAGGHRGMQSLIDQLGGSDFSRLRFGIGRPGPGEGVVDHVLNAFSMEDEQTLGPAIERACDALATLLLEGPDPAMDGFNG